MQFLSHIFFINVTIRECNFAMGKLDRATCTVTCSEVISDDASTLKPLIKSGQIHEKALNIFGTRALCTLLFGFVACHERKISFYLLRHFSFLVFFLSTRWQVLWVWHDIWLSFQTVNERTECVLCICPRYF